MYLEVLVLVYGENIQHVGETHDGEVGCLPLHHGLLVLVLLDHLFAVLDDVLGLFGGEVDLLLFLVDLHYLGVGQVVLLLKDILDVLLILFLDIV